MDELQNLIAEWNLEAEALFTHKKKEMELRKRVHELVFNSKTDPGTENYELGNGYKLKLSTKNNYKIDSTEAAEEMLSKLPDHYHDLVKWKPELSTACFNQLPPDLKSVVEEYITITPATPALELVKPKEVK